MPAAKYIVDLSDSEKERLQALISRGKSSARTQTRARILLKANEELSDEQIVQALDVGIATIGRVRRRFVEEGLERALTDKPRPGPARKIDGKQEAHLIAVACSAPPAGHVRWTLRLLAGKAVELGFTDSMSHETVRRMLKKTTSSRGRSNSGVFPR
jgi:transposase